MKKNRKSPFLIAALILISVTTACSSAAAPEPTATVVPVTNTSVATATLTPKPTHTPRPTATPNLQATQQAEEFNALLSDFQSQGYVSTTDGEYATLDPFTEDWAQLGWYQWYPFEDNVADFVFKAHFKWSTASETPEISGCGIIFGMQDNQDHYAVFLDRSRILFLMGRGANVYNVGKTRGPGRVNFGNPAEAEFVVSVKGQSAYVSVDNEVTEYTLSQDQTSEGEMAFTVLSGTNKDYGTRCEMTDIILWTPE